MNKNNGWMKWMLLAAGILLILAILAGVFYTASLNKRVADAQTENELLRLDNEQLQLQNEFDAVNSQFQQFESAARNLQNDSIFQKYTAAKQRVNNLTAELNRLKNERSLDRAKIAELQNEINTLRGLLRHYIAQIDSLSRENSALRSDLEQVRNENSQLSNSLAQTTATANELQNRMTLAEKLNVTGVSLSALKSNGKKEKNITKAKQLMVTFTIPQNNSTPVGAKTIFIRITNPEGQLLGSGGSFPFEGRNLSCTARKTVEYTGDELAGVTVYWDVNTVLTEGEYTVELFCDGYRLGSRRFSMTK